MDIDAFIHNLAVGPQLHHVANQYALQTGLAETAASPV
jgi:hypothetical protein